MRGDIQTAAVVGTGVIGAGWAARLLAHGLDVVAWDVADDWREKLRSALANAWPALEEMGLSPGAALDRLHCAESLQAACADADFVQESAPERLDLKRRLLAEIDAATAKRTPPRGRGR